MSISGIANHETIWPTTVFQFRSYGCIRVLPENIERFYDEVEIGTPGELVYEPVKSGITNDGKVFLEVDPDVYRKVKKPLDEVYDLLVAAEVDWAKIRRIVQEHAGIAKDVTLYSAPVTP